MKRWLVRLGIGVLILVVVLVVAAELALHSGYAARKVAASIEEVANTPVRVGTLDVGVTGSSLRNLEFLEPGATEGATPWAVIPRVDADLSLAQLARGDLAGGTVTLRDAKVVLRLDRDDHVVTKLPSFEGPGHAWPVFRVENAQVTFQREGRPDTVFRGIKGEVSKKGDTITLSGSADDPEWGQWTLGGGHPSADAPYSLTLHTDRLHATTDKLRRVPFVPPVTWEQVQLEGDTPVDVALHFGGSGGGPAVRYLVTLAPRDTTVHVSSIDLTARKTSGSARIEDGVVTLKDVRGQAAGGELRVNSTMDFRGEGSHMHFDVNAERLALKDLPRTWGLPPLDGRMTGKADMRLVIENGRVRTEGQGSGTVEGFLGKTLRVTMKADGRGYRFDITDTPGSSTGRAPAVPPALAALVAAGLVAAQAPAPQPPAGQPPGQPPTGVSVNSVPTANPDQPQDLQINLKLHDVDVAELVQRLGATVPFRLAGRLTFDVRLTVPMRDARDLKAYRFNGTVNLPWAQIEDLRLEQVQARAVYEQGVLRLEELSARVPDAARPGGAPPAAGTVRGTAQLGVVPAGDLTARLTMAAVPVGQVLRAIPNAHADGGGTADGDVELRAPADALKDIDRWEANGRLTGRNLRAFGRSAEELDFRLKLAGGTLSVTEARGRLQGATVSSTGQLRLADPYRYQAHLELPPSEVRAWQQVVPELRSVRLDGQARATADAHGTLHPLTVQAGGTAQVDGLAVNSFRVGTLRSRWDLDTDRLRLTDIAANLYGGDLTGSATVPLKPSVPGRVDLQLSKLDTTHLTKDVPQTPVHLAGTAQGSVAVNIPPAGPSGQRAITADIRLEAQGLRVQNIPTDKLHAEVKYQNDVATYSLKGQALGGEFELSGQYPSQPATPAAPPPPRPAAPPAPPPAPAGELGRLRVSGIDLGRLADALRMAALRPLGGRLDLSADIRQERQTGEPTGSGRFTLSRLSWGGRQVIDTLGGELQVSDGAIRMPEVTARVGGGELRARLTYDYGRPMRGVLILTVQRADARQLLAPFTANPPIDGPLDVRLVTRLGREWSGTGQVVLTYGKLFGIRVRDARFPLGWSFVPGSRGQLRLRDASAQASRGRLTGRATFDWGYEARLDGQAEFTAIDVGELVSQYSDTQVVGGQATGRIVFGGRNLRSVNDLTARVGATLAQTTAMQMPVLRQLVPFILPGQGANTTFSSGDVKGTLGGGVFRLERLSLVGQYARIFAQGTITLQQRLNLDVIASTQQLGIDPAYLRLLGLSLPAVGPIPLSLINEATSYLANRTIQLRVTGTIKAPSIQVNLMPLLTEEAVRFFLGQTGVPIPRSVLPTGVPGP